MRRARLRHILTLTAVLCAPAILRGATTVRVNITSIPEPLFLPQFVTVQVGDTVEWVNLDGTHNVVSDDDLFNSGFVQPPEGAVWPFKYTFTAVGEYGYYCSIHGNPGTGQYGIVFVRPARAANEIVLQKSAFDFEGARSDLATDYGPEPAMRHGNGTTLTEMVSGASLPTGAKITGLEITGCDDNASADLAASLFECPDPTGPCAPLVSASSTGSPGCSFFGVSLPDGPIVSNVSNTYILNVLLGEDETLRFRNVRIFYRRVLSPAPLTATFGDVSTSHVFFRAIEALAASGTTSGCGSGNYCPDDPVTRATMAGFLARAFGLFWPN
jgi:plastocyanin